MRHGPVTTILLCAGLLMTFGIPNYNRDAAAAAESALSASYLRCEYLVDPLGIDVLQPRLSWIVESNQRAQKQTAYHVLVASSRDALDRNQGDLWDSGKVESDQTHQVVYRGGDLSSRQRCYWKVRVWDAEGRPSEWSDAALWTMGLLQPDDWKADWIGYDKARREYEENEADRIWLKGTKWIWYDEPGVDLAKTAPAGQRFFRLEFDIPEDVEIVDTKLVATAKDSLNIFCNGEHTFYHRSDQGIPGLAGYFDIKRLLKPGRNVLAIEANKGGGSGPAGLAAKLWLYTRDGEKIEYDTNGNWLAGKEGGESWNQVDFKPGDDWKKARVVADFGSPIFPEVTEYPTLLPPPRYFRKEFSINKPLKRATAYATALGIYEVHLNGKRVSEDYLQPGWTEYNTRLLYKAYDVTDLLAGGDNAAGAILADGWYSGYIGYGGGPGVKARDHYGTDLRLRAQLHLEFEDGTEQVIPTDDSWRASRGPIQYSDFLQGEKYDARREIPGWDKPGYDAEWDPVDITKSVDTALEAYPTQPVRVFQEIEPVEITEPQDGVYIFNMGTNFAGFVRLKVKAPAGTKINLRFGERLWPDGRIYTENMRSARAIDNYICKGGGIEVWQPKFTFHGFQYVEVTGLPGKPTKDLITGMELTSDCPVVGSFECNDEMANTLYRNITQTQRANFIDIPTDCPQRDERLGWMGDAQVYIRTATYNNDVAAFFTKWLRTVNTAQRDTGEYTVVSPFLVAGGAPATAAWADAGIICPWTINLVYDDERVIREHYDHMAKYIEFLKQNAGDDLLRPAEGFGDWLSIKADTPKDVLATAYFANSARLMSQMAKTIGKDEDAQKYQKLYEDIRAAFNKAYVKPDGRIHGNTQTCYVLALAFDLLPEDLRGKAIDYLVEDIKSRDWHLSTGFIGTRDLMQVLTRYDQTDVAYRLFHQTTFPGWGFSIQHGATSIWERWDGWTPENGFQTPTMNSFAHYSFGAVAEWMFKTIGGIDTDGKAFKEIIIKPQPGGNVRRADVAYDSIDGMIRSRWRIRNDVLNLRVEVPANTTALVYVPTSDPEKVREGRESAAEADGVTAKGAEDGFAVYEVGSGTYRFRAPAPEIVNAGE